MFAITFFGPARVRGRDVRLAAVAYAPSTPLGGVTVNQAEIYPIMTRIATKPTSRRIAGLVSSGVALVFAALALPDPAGRSLLFALSLTFASIAACLLLHWELPLDPKKASGLPSLATGTRQVLVAQVGIGILSYWFSVSVSPWYLLTLTVSIANILVVASRVRSASDRGRKI